MLEYGNLSKTSLEARDVVGSTCCRERAMSSLPWWNNEAGSPSAAGKDDGVLPALTDWAGKAPRKWLLIAGAMDPPSGSGATSRVRDGGEKSGMFLEGIELDFRHMTKVVGSDLHNKVQDMRLKVREAKSKICDFFDECKKGECVPTGSGNWCFANGCLSFSDIWELLPVGAKCPWILADCCFSGHWANQALQPESSSGRGRPVLHDCP